MNAEQLSTLVEQTKNQDSGAIVQLYEAYHNEVYFLCLKIVKNEEDALDLVQDSFLQAFGKLDTLQNPAQFGAWLNQIAANKCRDYLKKKKPVLFSQQQSSNEDDEGDEPGIEDRDESLVPDKALDTEETRRLIMGIIDGLPDLQRMTVMLYYYEEKSIKEIAEIMECSENTVKSRLNYARKQVREGVLDLEKKGTKLYGVMPMLFPIIRHAASDFTLPSDASSSLLGNITSFLAAGPAQGTVGATSAATSHSAASQIVAKAAGAARKAVTDFSKLSLPAKIGAGIAVAAVVVGVGLGVSAAVRRSVPVQAVPSSSSISSALVRNVVSSQVSSQVSSIASSEVSSVPISSVPEVIPVTEISLSKTKISLTVGQKTMPIVTMSPKDATDQGEIWVSSNEKVATVDQSGNIKAVGAGACTITVSAKSNPSISNQVSVTVAKVSTATTKQNTPIPQKTSGDKIGSIKVAAATGDGMNTSEGLTTIAFSRLKNFSGDQSNANYSLECTIVTSVGSPSEGTHGTQAFWEIDSVQVGNSSVMQYIDPPYKSYIAYFKILTKGSTSVTLLGSDGKRKTVTINVT